MSKIKNQSLSIAKFLWHFSMRFLSAGPFWWSTIKPSWGRFVTYLLFLNFLMMFTSVSYINCIILKLRISYDMFFLKKFHFFHQLTIHHHHFPIHKLKWDVRIWGNVSWNSYGKYFYFLHIGLDIDWISMNHKRKEIKEMSWKALKHLPEKNTHQN
jgi:hypothetical protein